VASGFFALFDDISYLMDDVAAASKVATKKSARRKRDLSKI